MSNLFSDFADFIVGIFSDPEARRLRKELKELHDNLQSVRPALYQKNTQAVLPGLAESYFNLYQLMYPLYDLFSKTLNSPDKKVRELSLNFLVESLLVGEITLRRSALQYEALKSRFASSSNPSLEINHVTTEFNNILSDIKKQNPTQVNQEITALFQLKNLVSHNFASFFKKFGYDIALFGKTQPRFIPLPGDDLLPELLDLYYILGGFSLTSSMEKGLFLLLEKVSPSKAQENEKKMEKVLQKMQNLLIGPCSPYILLNLIRAIRREPQFMPEMAKGDENFVGQYVKEMTDRFGKDRDRASREVHDSSVNKEVSALFGDATHLLSLENYSEEMNEKLLGAGLSSLAHIKPLRILKSYAQAVLKTFFLDRIKAVIVDAFFQDKEFANRLSTSLYSAEGLMGRIDAFDEALATEAKNGFAGMDKYLKNKGQNTASANKILEAIDKTASELLEHETNDIATLASRVAEVLMDYKSPQPKNITNIKGLGGKNNREIMQGLIDGYNKTVLFLKLMKHFVVLKGAGKAAAEQA